MLLHPGAVFAIQGSEGNLSFSFLSVTYHQAFIWMLNRFVARFAASFLPSRVYYLCILGDGGSVSWLSSWMSDDEAVNFQLVSDDITIDLFRNRNQLFFSRASFMFFPCFDRQWSVYHLLWLLGPLESDLESATTSFKLSVCCNRTGRPFCVFYVLLRFVACLMFCCCLLIN